MTAGDRPRPLREPTITERRRRARTLGSALASAKSPTYLAEIDEIIAHSRAAQGLPRTIIDDSTLAAVADLFRTPRNPDSGGDPDEAA